MSRGPNGIVAGAFDIAGDTSYHLYLVRRDGSSPTLIGHGAASSFSADGKWLSSIDPAHPENLFIIPTGVGEARTLKAPAGRHYAGAAFFPDGKSLLITTVAAGQNPQSSIQDLESGAVRDFGPTGRYVQAHVLTLYPGPSPDGKYCVETDGQGRFWLQPFEGQGAREISGIGSAERIINWHSDANNIFLSRQDGANVQVTNLELASGRRSTWTTFSPTDKSGLTANSGLGITPDGAHFAYEAHRIYSTLFVANRVR